MVKTINVGKLKKLRKNRPGSQECSEYNQIYGLQKTMELVKERKRQFEILLKFVKKSVFLSNPI